MPTAHEVHITRARKTNTRNQQIAACRARPHENHHANESRLYCRKVPLPAKSAAIVSLSSAVQQEAVKYFASLLAVRAVGVAAATSTRIFIIIILSLRAAKARGGLIQFTCRRRSQQASAGQLAEAALYSVCGTMARGIFIWRDIAVAKNNSLRQVSDTTTTTTTIVPRDIAAAITININATPPGRWHQYPESTCMICRLEPIAITKSAGQPLEDVEAPWSMMDEQWRRPNRRRSPVVRAAVIYAERLISRPIVK